MSFAGMFVKTAQATGILGAVTRYTVAVAAVVVAVVVRLALNPILGEHSPYLPFALAVMVAARFGGSRAGFVATALSSLGVLWFFIEPVHSLTIADPAAAWGLALFILVGSLISLLAGHLQESLLSTARSEAILRRQAQLIELSQDAVITMDSDRRIVTWNAGAEQMYGWSQAEAKDKVTHELLQTSGEIPTTQIDDALRRDGRWDGELRHLTRDGRSLFVDSRQISVRDERNRPAGILEINRDVTEHKKAEQVLRESEERFRALTTATSEVMYRASPDWSELRYLLGGNSLASTGAPNRSWLQQYIPPIEQPRVTAAINEAIRTKSVFELEHRVVRMDGSVGWTFSRAIPVLDAGGGIVEWFGAASDITRRKQAEEALQESEERLRTAQEIAHIGTFEWNVETGVNRWTVELEAMYGLPPGGFSGTQEAWEKLVHPDDRVSALQRVQEAFDTGKPTEGEWRVVWPDGSVRWLAGRWQVFKDPSGTPLRMKGVNIDISERKRADEALRLASEQRRLALEGAHMGAWEYHLDTGQFRLDQHSVEIWGARPDGRASYDEVIAHIHPDDRAGVESAWKQALAGSNGGACHREYRILRGGGSVTWVASHGRVFFEGEGGKRRPVRAVGVSMEVTDRVLAEEHLRQTQKLESIGLLAGGVAHDFNNLLTVIMGNASSALLECPHCQHSQAVLGASERAAYLTKQLLAYAGKGQVVTRVFDLTDLVSRAAPLLSASIPKRVSLSLNLSKGLPPLEADPSQIEQILMNLVINAGEAIPPKTDGRIEIATSTCDVTAGSARKQSQAFEVQTGPHVCLEVTDNGTGMDEATISRIFDPFFSTKFTGRGLGLAAVHGIVRSTKGFIEVRSHPENGSTFRVFLPASANKRTAQEQPEPKSIAAREYLAKPAPILVVDDEEMVRKLACMMLRRHGYQVLEATDGKDALRVLEESATLPSVVLLDLAMPVMGGDELVPILETKYPTLKVIVSSGYPEEDARKGFTSAAVEGFLQKPYTASALEEKIEEVLNREPQPHKLSDFPTTG